MNKLERRTALSLAAVYAVRMLGLFMILPVLPLYAENFEEATPFLIGLAIGIYGLTQATFQIPLGLMSDRFGRKRIIIAGLIIFAIGSVVSALSDNIYSIIIGRAIQGMGAIAAATMALAADLTEENNRAKVMASIGMTIGVAFAVAMVVGPLINDWYGLSGIFWITALLALVGIGLVAFVVPTPKKLFHHRDAGVMSDYLLPAIKNANLLRMNIGVFILHMVMTANFTVLPLLFKNQMNIESASHWKIYLPVFALSFIFALPLIIIAEKYQKIKPLLIGTVATLILAQLGLSFGLETNYLVLASFLMFFISFNFLEAIQPSLVAKYSSVSNKGTAMGIFSTWQFMGIFVGGITGGFLLEHNSQSAVFLFGGCAALVWLVAAISLPKPHFYKSQLVKLSPLMLQDSQATTIALYEIKGIKEVAIAIEEGIAYLKVDKKELDETALVAFQ
ncbi:MFS transporter [Leucothrix arctica]|uniref:MFS transporter n=1 Tax=Leucothrix arctica TaxID=1481894 RepID=A0A317C6G2_9GAMM|nr:MFS transporter [Leucothrix arctica]PWQ94188.1 MFS transporter [Leucothrix arctica]